MKTIFTIFVVLILAGCESCTEEIQGDAITIGTTHKILYDSDILMIGDIDYQWSFTKKPENSYSVLLCSRDKALFTPDVPGDYEIHVFVDNEGVVSDSKDYFFTAVGDPTPVGIRSTKPEAESSELMATAELPQPVQQENIPSHVVKADPPEQKNASPVQMAAEPAEPDSTPVYFTIQAFSQSDQKIAIQNRDMLIKNGFPAYIQSVRLPGNERPWYRVRIGKYGDLNSAAAEKKVLSDLLKSEKLWIDTLRSDG